MKSLLKKNIKQDYTIEFKHIKGLDIGDNIEVVLKWRRGDKKENKGTIEKALVHNGEIIYSPVQVVHIHCTLFLTKNGYDEKGLEISLHTTGKKTKELCEGFIDLAKYADLNGASKDLSVKLIGKNPAIVEMSISSLLGEAGGSSDETEVLQMKASATTDIHELLVQQVSKKQEEDEKEEELEEKQRKQKEIAEREEAERQKKLQEQQQIREADMFAAASSSVKIKGKKEKDTKKKFTQEDLDKACEKAVREALKMKKEKYHKIRDDLQNQLKNTTESLTQQKENAIKEKENEIDELNKKISSLEEEVKEKETLKISLANAESNGKQLSEVIEKNKIEREEEKKQVEQQLEELKKEKKEEENKKEELKKQLEEEQKEKSNIKVALAASEAVVVGLKAEVEKKENEITEQKKKDEQEKEELKKRIEETEKNAAAGSEQILNQKNAEIEQVKNEKDNLNKEIEELKKINKEIEEKIEKQQKEVEESNKRCNENIVIIEQQKKDIENIKEEKEELIKKNNEKEEEIKQVITQNEILKKRIEEFENNKGDDIKTSVVLTERIEELTQGINEEREKNKIIEEKYSKEVNNLNNKIKEFEENQKKQEEEKEKKIELIKNDKEKEINELKIEIENLKKEHKEEVLLKEKIEDKQEKEIKIVEDYEKSEMKYNENNKPVFGLILKKYINEGETKEIQEFEIIKNFGECDLENSVYLLNSIIEVTQSEKTEYVERNNTLKNQLMNIQYKFFIKCIQIASSKLNGFIELMIKDNQCFERRRAAEFEQLTANYTVNYLKEINKILKKNNTNDITQKQIMIQVITYMSYFVINTLIQNDKFINCSKGLQLKFFFSIMEAELCENRDIFYLRDYLQLAIETSGLLVLDHSNEHFNVKEIHQTLPHLSGSIIYALLSRFKPDNLNNEIIDKSVLSQIDKNDTPIPSCFELIKY
ncbi:N-terminal C2 in EEIG1 and EHBP1 proteins/DIL domain containing protein, putative [Entamoeba histolytica]